MSQVDMRSETSPFNDVPSGLRVTAAGLMRRIELAAADSTLPAPPPKMKWNPSKPMNQCESARRPGRRTARRRVRAVAVALSFGVVAGACRESVDEHGMTALMRAARDGDRAAVITLIGDGADVDRRVSGYSLGQRIRGAFFLGVPDRDVGWTPLMYASSNRHRDVARALLDAGANPNTSGTSGLRALTVACLNRDIELARALLDAGAEPNDGAVVAAAASLELSRMVLEAGGDPNAEHIRGSPLRIAANKGDAAVVALFLEHGADVNRRDPQTNASALQLATRRGHQRVAELLRNAGAGDGGIAGDALVQATVLADVQALRRALADGASAGTRDDTGTPVLVIAARRGLFAIVDELLEAGADPNVRDRIDGSALAGAAGDGHIEVVERLIDAGADGVRDERAFIAAAGSGRLAVVRALLNAGASVDAAGGAALRAAARSDHAAVVDELLANGADVNARGGNGMTALMRAVPSVEITRRLVAAGADVNARDDLGTTALIFAAAVGNTDAVRILLDAGADSSHRNANGATALDEARRMRYEEIANLLSSTP